MLSANQNSNNQISMGFREAISRSVISPSTFCYILYEASSSHSLQRFEKRIFNKDPFDEIITHQPLYAITMINL